jgi:hypothetical protein
MQERCQNLINFSVDSLKYIPYLFKYEWTICIINYKNTALTIEFVYNELSNYYEH